MTFSSRKLQVCKSLVVFALIGMLGTTGVVFAKAKRHAAARATSIVTQKPKVTEAGADNPEGTEADAKASAPGEPLADLAAPVQPVVTPPLRELPPIPWWEAPVSEHPEPVLVEGPIDTKIPDISTMQLVPGPQSSAPTPTGVSWDGVGVGLAGFLPNGNPPDVNGRVGGTQYVQWNNTSFAVFDKTTGALLYGPASGNTLFQSLGGACATHNDGDPVVAYDILAGRWILSQFVVAASPNASHQCVAVSATQDATGAYYLYDFVTDTTNFIDYPHMGVWPDGYYMSAHAYNAAGTSFLNGRIYVFERMQMIQGLPARMQFATLGSQFGFLPADLDSLTPPPAGEAEFLVGPSTSTALASTRVTVTWGGTPTIATLISTIPISTAGTPPCSGGGRRCVPQPSPALSTDNLDSLSNHMMYRLAYRNFGGSPVQESLVATSLGLGSTPTPTHGVIRWYELRNAGSSTTVPTVFQFSNFNPDNVYRFMASIAMDNSHDIAVGYSKSSSTVLPSIWINGRLGTDTINTLGTEAQVQAGGGVQMVSGANDPGNRWGDYSSLTLDPVDQCTFYYTNEYLKTNGAFNWSTRIASYKFPSCAPAAAWGTVAGTITSCATGAPVSGVVVTLSNGYAASSNASGAYSILVPAGSYTATASNAARNCAASVPSSASVTPVSGGTFPQDFCMSGASNLQANGLTFDDSTGNGNGVINSNECVGVNLKVKNNGCATETAISATMTTSTPGVTVTQASSSYPDLVIDQSSNATVPFRIQTSNSFLCGTTIALSLNLTYTGGSKTLNYTVHTCEGGPSQTIPLSSIVLTDSSQPDRLGRTGVASTCAGKACPGPINTAGSRNYKKFTFFNGSGSAECFTVTINAALGGGGDIQVAAYQNTYTPPVAQGDAAGNMCLNFLGDTGITGLGTTVSSAAFSFTAAANANFVVVVDTSTGSTTSSQFSGTVSGFVSTTPGPGPCTFCSGQPNGTACNDGNACTQSDTCQNNVCVGGNPVVCSPLDQCHDAGTCNTGTGVCSNPTRPDGSACTDGNACTQTDTCQGGTCTGSNPVFCNDSNPCTDDACNPATGLCMFVANDGNSCTDGNACTNDACSGGTCVFAPSGACGAAGSVFYYRTNEAPGTEPTSKPVPSVDIDSNGDATAEATTDGSGSYSITNLSGHVTLAPLAKYGSPRASDHNGAISSLDASLISRTVVGTASMSPNQRLAGDVTGNGTISGLDASEVARFAVGLVDHFDVGTATGSDWKFLRCDAYAYPGNPGCGAALYDYNPITGPVSGQNFYAVLYGEVTGNWQPAGAFAAAATTRVKSSLEEQAAVKADRIAAEKFRLNPPVQIVRNAGDAPAALTLTGSNAPLKAGETRQYTINLSNADGILALDLAFRYDPAQITVVGVSATGIGSALNVAHGDLNGSHLVSAYGVLPLSGSGSVLTVTIQAVKTVGARLPMTITGTANERKIPLQISK